MAAQLTNTTLGNCENKKKYSKNIFHNQLKYEVANEPNIYQQRGFVSPDYLHMEHGKTTWSLSLSKR